MLVAPNKLVCHRNMLEHLNMQSIAKWFESGCSCLDSEAVNKNEKGFYILECNDICLLSKLTDVKNATLMERSHKQLQQIKEPQSRKDFLLTICNEFLRDGRRTISLAMITEEIDTQSELYQLFRSDLLFHRALCFLKHDQPTEALHDLYGAFENDRIQSLEKIHVQILEEIKNLLQNHKFKEGSIVTKNKSEITFEQVLKLYENEICQFVEQKMEKQQVEYRHKSRERVPRKNKAEKRPRQSGEQRGDLNKPVWCHNNKRGTDLPAETVDWSYTRFDGKDTNTSGPTYKSKLIGSSGVISRSELGEEQSQISNDQEGITDQNQREITQESEELDLSYVLENYEVVRIKAVLQEQIIDNIFNLRAILVEKLKAEASLNTVCEIFAKFGTIVNLRYKDNSSKLIIEYDNADSPRFAISYLSQVPLPCVSENKQCLHFRFYKSENQRNLRICKQNQIKTSRECYFWRTTGCQNVKCKFYHNKVAKGVDYQEWMKIEQLRGPNSEPPY